MVLRQVPIAPRHYEGVQVAWRWCGNQNDDGVGAAMDGVEANVGGVETNVGGVETHWYGVQTDFGGVEASSDCAQAFRGSSCRLALVRKPK